MADENKCSPLEAILMKGLNYAFVPSKIVPGTQDYVYCKAAVVVPIQRCMIFGPGSVLCDRALRLYDKQDSKVYETIMRVGEKLDLDYSGNSSPAVITLIDVRYFDKTFKLCALSGGRIDTEKKDFSDIAGLKYAERTAAIESYVANWLKEVFKDGT